jgi:hypothetical protein
MKRTNPFQPIVERKSKDEWSEILKSKYGKFILARSKPGEVLFLNCFTIQAHRMCKFIQDQELMISVVEGDILKLVAVESDHPAIKASIANQVRISEAARDHKELRYDVFSCFHSLTSESAVEKLGGGRERMKVTSNKFILLSELMNFQQRIKPRTAEIQLTSKQENTLIIDIVVFLT